MKTVSTAIAIFALAQPALVRPAWAESCQEKFVRVMTERSGASEPTRNHVTQEIVGGMKSVNWNLQDGKGNWRTEMIEPETLPWSMVVDNVLYSSFDKGETWKQVREMDAGASPEAVAAMQAERAKSVRNAECGEEEFDGVIHETAAADYDMAGGYEVHDKYWIHPDTGFIPKLETRIKGDGFESFSTQVIEPAPGLAIEKPQ